MGKSALYDLVLDTSGTMELSFRIDMGHADAKALIAGIKTQGYQTNNGNNVNERFVQILGSKQVADAIEVLFQQGYLSRDDKKRYVEQMSREPELRAKREESQRSSWRQWQRGSDN